MIVKKQFMQERSLLPRAFTIIPSFPVLGRGHSNIGHNECKACREGDGKHHTLDLLQLEKMAKAYAL